jgi:hypothetical protein
MDLGGTKMPRGVQIHSVFSYRECLGDNPCTYSAKRYTYSYTI